MADRTYYPSEVAERFVVRLPDGMRDEIKAAAERNGRSMNSEMLERLSASGIGSGKTLRDEFAMAALSGMLCGPSNVKHNGRPISGESEFAAAAFVFADAMLAERQKGGA